MSKPVIDKHGNKLWYNSDGKLHREDGPAVEYPTGYKEWIFNGMLHCEDGPAVEWSDGSKEWWLNSKLVYNDYTNNLGEFELSEEMKKSIIKYKLKQ
jgi:hypothetical protein